MVPRAHNHAPVGDFIWCVPTVKDPRSDECCLEFTVAAIQNGFDNPSLDVQSNFLGFISLKRMEQYNRTETLSTATTMPCASSICNVDLQLNKSRKSVTLHTCLDKQEGFNPTEHSQTNFLHE